MTKKEISLAPEQQKTFQIIEGTGDHIFVTGKAGTGKSHLLQYLRKNSKKNLVVVAPTGVAALNVTGQTIHSLFRIPPSFIEKDSLRFEPRVAALLKEIDTVVIDEISMVRADLMDAIDVRLRQAKGNNMPFGGVQMVMFGDLYQLQPIVADKALLKYFADNHGGFYFFHADVWKRSDMNIYELTTMFRQTDAKFVSILNAIRSGEFSERTLFELNERAREVLPPKEVIVLATTNNIVQRINEKKLQELSEHPYKYEAYTRGKFEKGSFPTDASLILKKGAQVMMMKNDKNSRWVNGTLATVSSLTDKEIKVHIDGEEHTVTRETWSKVKYYYDRKAAAIKEEEVSAFTQYPLRLAWAVTIHKSQGQTYDRVAIDMGQGSFAHGQTYVALSRARSMEGVYLNREIYESDIIVDPAITKFMNSAAIIPTEN